MYAAHPGISCLGGPARSPPQPLMIEQISFVSGTYQVIWLLIWVDVQPARSVLAEAAAIRGRTRASVDGERLAKKGMVTVGQWAV